MADGIVAPPVHLSHQQVLSGKPSEQAPGDHEWKLGFKAKRIIAESH